MLSVVVLACASASAPAATPIPEGTALWFACTEPVFTGPLSLRCPLPYDPLYLETFLTGFTRFTPENEFKMQYLEPGEDDFHFGLADQIARFAQVDDKTIRGHTLLWNQQNPWWLTHPLFAWTRVSLESVMHTYISTVVGHFAAEFPGVVTEWDVINEPLMPDGALASSPWGNVIGPGYMRLGLEWAHAADPAARLLINEDGADVPGPKSDALLALATSLKESGAPLDAVGFEAHVTPDTAPSLQDLVSLWRRYKQVGLDVEVTELDVDNDGSVDDPAAKQAVFLRYAQACRMVGNCVGFTVWGVADPYSWLGATAEALLYDADFVASPVVETIHRLLAGLPAEPTSTTPAAHGSPEGSDSHRRGRVHKRARPRRHHHRFVAPGDT